MAVALNWSNLRPWNGSVQNGFEELCCQLARNEKVPEGSRFVRKGAPDAGVECYWQLAAGQEWAWQVKFFQTTPGAAQWRQLDQSVRTALQKHPALTQYFICLPLERADPRIPDQSSFMSEWEQHVEKWNGWANKQGRAIEFVYWGSSDIIHRLSRSEHAGRRLFWFGGEVFCSAWFKTRLDIAIRGAGERYTPALNVELPVSQLFEGLGWTRSFFVRLKKIQGAIGIAFSQAHESPAQEPAAEKHHRVQERGVRLLSFLGAIDPENPGPVDTSNLRALAVSTREAAWELLADLQMARGQELDALSAPETLSDRVPRAENRQHDVGELVRELSRLVEFAASPMIELTRIPALLLLGNAGAGKTHLLCDVARRRVEAGLPTVLLLGQQFGNEPPLRQIVDLLGLSCSTHEFLGALNAAGEAAGRRALLMIDALNEGDGRTAWRDAIAGIITALQEYRWIGLVVTVRTSYESQIIPQSLGPQDLIRHTHEGFLEHEYDAAQIYFDAYGIQTPSIPHLQIEFSNPLFLSLFCRGLKNCNLTMVPRGHHGLTTVFNFLIDSVNAKLAAEDQLDYDPADRVVRRSMLALAAAMTAGGKRWIPRETARQIINAELYSQTAGHERSLFRRLLSEGLLAEDRFRQDDGHLVDGIRFTYERVGDHMIVSQLLDQACSEEEVIAALAPAGPIGRFLVGRTLLSANRGILDGLTIQLPERMGKELVELAPHLCNSDASWPDPVTASFIESLVWRDAKSITVAAISYINGQVTSRMGTYYLLLDALLTLASVPDHPLNALFLDQHLRGMTMTDRDAVWSIFLHGHPTSHGVAHRLVGWAWSRTSKVHVLDESVRLAAIALGWCLSTSNRFIRDGATKALVSVLEDRGALISEIVSHFWGIDDVYIVERILAVAYGWAMRSKDPERIAELAQLVYRRVFEDGNPIPHVLLRDYARGVIEVAAHRGISLDINLDLVRPPYRSNRPGMLPSPEDLQKILFNPDQDERQERGAANLYSSVMGFADFARYVIGTNSGTGRWTTRPLTESPILPREELVAQFLLSLTDPQRRLWNEVVKQPVTIITDFYITSETGGVEELISTSSRTSAISPVEDKFRNSLRGKKRRIFDELVIPYLRNQPEDLYTFSLDEAQRFVLYRALNLGWTSKLFGHFDSAARSAQDFRSPHKAERIGKKYQWLGWHEFLARMADNYYYRQGEYGGRMDHYQGPWQSYSRDIDPSCLSRGIVRGGTEDRSNAWWCPTENDDWNRLADDDAWLKDEESLPDVRPLLTLTQPDDGSHWLALGGVFNWDEQVAPEADPYGTSQRVLYYRVRPCAVRKSDAEAVAAWALEQAGSQPHFLDAPSLRGVFLREYSWAPAYRFIDAAFATPEEGRSGWWVDTEPPAYVLEPTDRYAVDSQSYDCSITTGIQIHLPANWLMEGMQLSFSAQEGYYIDNDGCTIAYDPSVDEGLYGTLLVSRERLLAFLESQDFELIWLISGEKHFRNATAEQQKLGWFTVTGIARMRDGKICFERRCKHSQPAQ